MLNFEVQLLNVKIKIIMVTIYWAPTMCQLTCRTLLQTFDSHILSPFLWMTKVRLRAYIVHGQTPSE